MTRRLTLRAPRLTARRAVAASAAAVLLTGLAAAAPSSAAEPTVTEGCIASVPEPGSAAPVDICYSLFKPAGASASKPVPLVFHSHGWGGSRTRTASSFSRYLEDGYGVLSFDQRGFGQSGGRAHTLQADVEAFDVLGLVDLVAAQDWVEQEKKGDPLIGAIGGSYGGGYQYLGAFAGLQHRGVQYFDALAPEITWNDLKDALAPDEVARGTWLSLLTAVSVNDNDERAQRGFAYGAATGLWPGKGNPTGIDMDSYFEKTGPKWHVGQGRRLDVPTLIGQGTSDTLFNLNQGLANYDTTLTPQARAQSVFVGYNGGHVLETVLPDGAATSGDPCSKALGGGSFADLAKRFFDAHLKGKGALPGTGQYHLGSMDAKECITVDSTAPTTAFELGDLPTTTAAGAPVAHEIAAGPLTVAGVPRVDATVTTTGVNAKAFFALSVGTSPATAQVVQHNMMPLHEELPLVGSARSVELPGVAVNVPAGQKLFLTVSPVSDMSASSGSRVPGAVVLRGTTVHVPVVDTPVAVRPAAAPAPAPADQDEREDDDADEGDDD